MDEPIAPRRQLATRIVRKLVDAGYTALFAGGCVRDDLLGRPPKDYDVATNASPEQVRQIFGKGRTLAIGAQFGVISVLGDNKQEGQVDVATFRNDGAYIDGRRPNSITFSSPEEDAQRRDFTINGLFYDPLAQRIIDYVGGREDMDRKLLRAIGDPVARFEEDKLRMLRAIRFAAEIDFKIDPATFVAIQQLASKIHVVSGERIAGEMSRALTGAHPGLTVHLLNESGLLNQILPETGREYHRRRPDMPLSWSSILADVVEAAAAGGFAAALATLLVPARWHGDQEPSVLEKRSALKYVQPVAARWRLSNEVRDAATLGLAEFPRVIFAHRLAWSQLQPLLIEPAFDTVWHVANALVTHLSGLPNDGLRYCRERLELSPEVLNPPHLVTGDDLKRIGMAPGPEFRDILQQVRNQQLDGQITSQEAGFELARKLAESA